jgi:hypothetical protein
MSTDTTKKSCDYNAYKRVRYFHGMLLTERDFQEEQIYHQEKRRLLNRMLHGWGIVCGLGVKPTKPESSKIVISPGMALDCLGNEIVVCNDFEVDLKKLPSLCPDTSAGDKDPCAERQTEDCKYYIGIKYTEAPTDPVAVYLPGGSCEEKTCEYSRTREGFCVNLFKSPPCYAVLPKDGLFQDVVDCTKGDASNEDKLKCVAKVIDDFHSSFCEQPYPCPACCCDGEPYVILGSIDLTATKCVVTTIKQEMIEINDGRRYVRTPMFWQYYLGSFFPQINEFLDNPFVAICRALGQLSDQLGKIVATPEVAGRLSAVNKMASVNRMSEEQAKVEIAKQDLVYNSTVAFSTATAPSLAARAVAIGTIAPKTRVDLVTNKEGKVLFYMPAAEARETVDMSGLRKEMEAKVTKIQEENTAKLKTMDAAYQKQLGEMNKTIKELKKKIG